MARCGADLELLSPYVEGYNSITSEEYQIRRDENQCDRIRFSSPLMTLNNDPLTGFTIIFVSFTPLQSEFLDVICIPK